MNENSQNTKKIIFSGIQPSGTLTLGNYLGAIKNWVNLQDDYNCFYSVVDLHSLTVRNEPSELRKRSIELMAALISCGIDPERATLFFQSHVPAHSQLSWVLGCYAMFGELSRMTQFKDKSRKNADNINAGLFTYPVLMAADILLYKADLVPIGADQKQHLELARDIAIRFNAIYGDTFTVPEGFFPKVGAKIMSLAEPAKKMSKSDDNENSYIGILDKPEDIMRKFKRAVTDSEAEIKHKKGKDGINNLMTIYSVFTGKTFSEIEKEFEGKGYGDFKNAVGEAAVEGLRPVREKFEDLMKNKDYLEKIYSDGAKKAIYHSSKVLDKVYKKIGLIKRSFGF